MGPLNDRNTTAIAKSQVCCMWKVGTGTRMSTGPGGKIKKGVRVQLLVTLMNVFNIPAIVKS